MGRARHVQDGEQALQAVRRSLWESSARKTHLESSSARKETLAAAVEQQQSLNESQTACEVGADQLCVFCICGTGLARVPYLSSIPQLAQALTPLRQQHCSPKPFQQL